MLNSKLAQAILKETADRHDASRSDSQPDKLSLSKHTEGKRLQGELPNCGFDMEKICCCFEQAPTACDSRLHAYSKCACSMNSEVLQLLFCDMAFDGVQMGKKYTVNMFLLRCRDAPPHLAVNSSNIHLLMLVPGAKDPPQGFATHMNCIMQRNWK